MAKLLDHAKNAGMNSGAEVLAKMKRLTELKKHPELESIFLIQPDILSAIAESMKQNGYDKAQPIVEGKFDGGLYIVDGYTRYAAAIQAEIEEVPVNEKEFESLEAAVHYCYKRQAERRNLSQIEIYNAAVKLNIPAQQIADELGVAVSTITRVKKIEREADPEDIAAIKNNEKTINAVYNHIKTKKPQKTEAIPPGGHTDGASGYTGSFNDDTPDTGTEPADELQPEITTTGLMETDILDDALVETNDNGLTGDPLENAIVVTVSGIEFLKSAVILLAEAGEIKSSELLINGFLRNNEKNAFLKLLPDSVSEKLAADDISAHKETAE
jgi:Trp operon repressor